MKKNDRIIIVNNYQQSSTKAIMMITRAFTDVGTVSYPKKFGSKKFPITFCELKIQTEETTVTKEFDQLWGAPPSARGAKDFSRLCVSEQSNNITGSMQDYKNWCLYNGIMKSIPPII